VTIIDHQMLVRQLEAALDMLSDALRDCPDLKQLSPLQFGTHFLYQAS
jgi:hypothetical protein